MAAKGSVLLIVHDVYQEDNVFPLGVAYLAAILRNAGYGVEIYPMDVYHYTHEQLARKLDETEYDLIGFGFLAARFRETVIGLIDVIHAHKRGAWLAVGGHGPSPIPEYVLAETKADIVAVGEADKTILDLMECRTQKGDLARVKGIAYRRPDGSIAVNPRQDTMRGIDAVPLPAWDLFPMDIYSTNMKFPRMTEKDKSLAILMSRGCVGKCNFCYQLEPMFRMRKIPAFVEEMRLLNERYGITYYYLIDDLSVTSKWKLVELRDELKRVGLKPMLNVEVRADMFNEEIADLLQEVGAVFINVGFESMTQKVLDRMGKRVKVEQNVRTAEIITSRGVGLGINFMWGQPGDDEQSLRASVDFIKRFTRFQQVRTMRPVTPYPGSRLYHEAIQQGLLKGPGDFFDRFKNSDLLTVNFTGMPDEECYRLLLAANKELIDHHFSHTTKDMAAAARLLQQFKDLYEGRIVNFRGARAYTDLKHKNAEG